MGAGIASWPAASARRWRCVLGVLLLSLGALPLYWKADTATAFSRVLSDFKLDLETLWLNRLPSYGIKSAYRGASLEGATALLPPYRRDRSAEISRVMEAMRRPLYFRECSHSFRVDYPGGNLEDLPFSNPFQTADAVVCAHKCSSMPECGGYSFCQVHPKYKLTQLCFLKGKIDRNPTPVDYPVESGWCKCPPNGCYRTKLVVNTYRTSPYIGNLVYSLIAQSFLAFSDVIFVVAGDWEDSPPSLEPICDSLPIEEDELSVVIRVRRANFDLHGYSPLYQYRDDLLVKASGYLYVLDSVTFDPNFPQVFSSFNFSDRSVIYTVGLPNSNIAAFGAGVVEAFGMTFQEPISKLEGLVIEHGRGYIRGVKPLICWGNPVILGKRFLLLNFDLRVGAETRRVFNYQSFGLHKYIKWGKDPPPPCKLIPGCRTMEEHCKDFFWKPQVRTLP